MKTGTFLISNRRNGEFQFSLKDQNNQPILISDGYRSKEICLSVVQLIREKGTNNCTFEHRTSDKGEFYFNLISPNSFLICRSNMYNSRDERDRAVEQIKLLVQDAEIEDRVKIKEYY